MQNGKSKISRLKFLSFFGILFTIYVIIIGKQTKRQKLSSFLIQISQKPKKIILRKNIYI